MEIGKTQKLTVDRITEPGAYLTDGSADSEAVLLPNAELRHAGKLSPGDEIEVFLYLDSEDRPVATLKKPKIELGGFAPLTVKEVTKIGAFLDWGLDKDLLLPFSEQSGKIQRGKNYLVSLYKDKSGRLAATTKIYPLLRTDSDYKRGDWTEGYVYQINPKVGAFVAVDNQYSGMIRAQDLNPDVHTGKNIKVRVTGINREGKLLLSPIKKAYKEIDNDAHKILSALQESGGSIPYGDKSDAQDIKEAFGISKSAFKKAVGRLLKEGKIETEDGGIRLVEK